MRTFLTTTIVALMLTQTVGAQQMPAAPTLEEVLENYPSRAELQSWVDEYKSAHPAEFAASRADFDLAIRSMLTLEFPERPDKNRRHVERKPKPLPSYFTRPDVLDRIDSCSDKPEYSQWLAFYQQHIDEIVVDEAPALRFVYLDVLLNGWDDWSNWQSAKLTEARESYPDLHVKYALEGLGSYWRTPDEAQFASDTFGVVLPIVLDQTRERSIRQPAEHLLIYVGSISKDVDLLRYCLDAAASATDRETRLYLFSISSAASGALRQPEYREFWVDYLQHPDEWVRTKAVNGIVESIRKPRPGEPPRPRDAELAQMLYDVLQNDPSPRVRIFLQPRLEYYERSDTRPTHRGGKISEPPQPLPLP